MVVKGNCLSDPEWFQVYEIEIYFYSCAYLSWGLVPSLNNPLNIEMNYCENMTISSDENYHNYGKIQYEYFNYSYD